MSETPMTEVAAEPETTETPTPETAAPKRSRRELLEREGEVAADFLETLLDIADLDGDIDLDIDGDRAAVAAARRAELVELAQQAIDTVKSSGESVDLDPMSAFERKVVHDEVLAAGLVSDSSGTEPRRYVVVHPAEAAAGDQSTDASTSDSAAADSADA